MGEKYELTYTRYADDMTFSGDHIPVKFISIVSDIVKNEGFQINSEKTSLLRNQTRKIITGISVSSGKPCIPREKKRFIRQQLYFINKYGIKSHMKRKHIDDPYFPLRVQGYLTFWKLIEPNNTFVKKIENK